MAKVDRYTIIVNYDKGLVKLLGRKPASLNKGWEIPEDTLDISRKQADEYIRAWSPILTLVHPKEQAAA